MASKSKSISIIMLLVIGFFIIWGVINYSYTRHSEYIEETPIEVTH
jgi:regulatory protein YycI of two-component signal transduction system YycFG